MGSPLGAAKYNSLLQGAASLDGLGTTGIVKWLCDIICLLCFTFSVRTSPCRLWFCFFSFDFPFVIFSLLFFRLTFHVFELVLGLGYNSVRLGLGYLWVTLGLVLGNRLALSQGQVRLGLGQLRVRLELVLGQRQVSLGLAYLLTLGLGKVRVRLAFGSDQGQVRATVRVKVRVKVRVRFIFYIYFVSTQPTALSSCVSVKLQKVVE